MNGRRTGATMRAVLDEAVVTKVRHGRLRDVSWPYGLGAVVTIGVILFALAGLLALVSAPVRARSSLTVPNTLTSSVPDNVIWALILLLAFCLALLTTAAIHGPWWLTTIGLLVLVLVLGVWSAVTTVSNALTLAVVLAVLTFLLVGVLRVVRRRRGLAWWEFPLVLGSVGVVLVSCTLLFARTGRRLGFRLAPVYVDQTINLLTFLVLPAAFAAGAAVAEIAVGLAMAATRTAQRRGGGRWPYVVLAAMVVVRLVQEAARLSDLDPVNSGWLAILPALGLMGAFTGLGWAISRLTRLDEAPVLALPEELGRIAIPVGAAVIAMMLPVYVLVFGFQIVGSLSPAAVSGAVDPSPVLDRLIDGFRVLLGAGLIAIGLWRARRGQAATGLVLGAAGVMLIALGVRLLTGHRWAVWLDPDALVSVVTLLVLIVVGVLLVRRRLTSERALGLSAVLLLAALLSLRSVVADPFAALLGYSGVAFVLFGVVWDFLTGSGWANLDGPRVRRPVRVLLAVGYPLLTVTVLASGALIRRPRTASYVNVYAELGELVLGTALLAAATVVVLSVVRRDRQVV